MHEKLLPAFLLVDFIILEVSKGCQRDRSLYWKRTRRPVSSFARPAVRRFTATDLLMLQDVHPDWGRTRLRHDSQTTACPYSNVVYIMWLRFCVCDIKYMLILM